MWDNFQKHFKEKYLTWFFYDEKEKEFQDLKLGQHMMDEFITKFTYLLRYVSYIREEKDKVKCFKRNIPAFMKEKLEFDNPKTMDEAIWKDQICYQHMKQKRESSRGWPNKKGNFFFKIIGMLKLPETKVYTKKNWMDHLERVNKKL